MFTATDNLDEFERTVAEANRAISNGIRKGVSDACAEGAEEARTTHKFTPRSGASGLEASIKGRVEVSTPGGARGVIEATKRTASFVEGGTQPHEIEARGNALRFEAGGQAVYRKRVQHPGTAPDGFMGRAYQKAERVVEREVEVGIANAEKILAG